MGLFVVFEGIEGCGKTTQITLLGDFLRKKQFPYLITREPGGTSIGEKIRKILLHADNQEIFPLTELLLYTASRVQHLQQIIKPALEKNKVVLCDRFFDATVAYQGYGEGLSLTLIYEVHRLFLNDISPELTILLDCPAELGLNRSKLRIKAQGKEKEEGRFEEKELQFHERVRQGYLHLAEEKPERFHIVNAVQSIASVQQEICLRITEALKEKGYAV